ncbi:MAG: MBL fold hydrolase [Chlamydiae bacterium CG10_big_fil_rev_8_21_14_0_10_42_34]|nr:MAG: MBL fold hydrolase [Chlamydiae bacterium CG10_big_fil_rev_8_21_14_0_10_42_34]
MIFLKFPFGPLETNALLIGCNETKKAAVIDPSLGCSSAILKSAEENGLHIEKILLTHSHWDHFADADVLKSKTGAPLYVHPLDANNLLEPGSDHIPLFVTIHPVKADHLIREGEVICVGNLKLEVIHTPGHSPGGVCFYVKEQNLLISGDTLFKGTIGTLSLPTAQPEEMWKSLEKLSKLPPTTRVVPGHGADTTIGKETWLCRAKEIFSE